MGLRHARGEPPAPGRELVAPGVIACEASRCSISVRNPAPPPRHPRRIGARGLDQRMPRSALHFGVALVEARSGSRAVAIGDALIRQRAPSITARRRRPGRLGPARGSRGFAERSREAVGRTAAGRKLNGRGGRDPDRPASRKRRRVLSHGRSPTSGPCIPVRVPALHLLLARAHLARGLDDEAEKPSCWRASRRWNAGGSPFGTPPCRSPSSISPSRSSTTWCASRSRSATTRSGPWPSSSVAGLDSSWIPGGRRRRPPRSRAARSKGCPRGWPSSTTFALDDRLFTWALTERAPISSSAR